MFLIDAKLDSIVIAPKPLIQVVEEVCESTEPKPLNCEWPDDLKVSFRFAGGTVSDYIETVNSPYSIVGTASIYSDKL